MILGCILGLLLKNFEASWLALTVYNILVMLGTVFVRLLKMIMVPLIFSSIILGVSSIGSGKKIGRIGLKTLCYYLFTKNKLRLYKTGALGFIEKMSFGVLNILQKMLFCLQKIGFCKTQKLSHIFLVLINPGTNKK